MNAAAAFTLTWQLVRGRATWYRPTTWVSPIIGWFGDGYYTHIDVLTPQGMLRGARSDVIQGIPAGYQDRPQNYEEWVRCTRFTLPVRATQYSAYWDFSDAQLHKPYDSFGLLKTFLLERNWRDDSKWWCSEEVAANGEFARLWQVDPMVNGVTPGDMVYLLEGAHAVRQEMPV